MRWLNSSKDDTGAVAVVVAVAAVALCGAAALAVDIGAQYSERGQLQNGADAAAFAIAQTCAATPTAADCTSPAVKAQNLANSNTIAGAADVKSITVGASSVTVTVAKTVPAAFSAVFGSTGHQVSAAATASWGTPSSGPAVLPVAFASCTFTAQPKGTAIDLFNHVIGDSSGSCTDSHNGMNLPGGFGWLDDPSGTCNLGTVVTGNSYTASSNTGNSASNACKNLLPTLLGQTVLLPVFDSVSGTGTTGKYHVAGWAGFQLLGWRFPGTSQAAAGYPGLTISSPNTGLIGKFLGFATLDERFTLGPANPPYANVVALTK